MCHRCMAPEFAKFHFCGCFGFFCVFFVFEAFSLHHLFPVFVCFWFSIVALIAAFFFFSWSSFTCLCVFGFASFLLLALPGCGGRLLFFLSTKQKKARNFRGDSGRFQNGGTLTRYMSENFTSASGSGCDAGLTPPRRSSEPLVSEVNEGQSLSAARPSQGWRASLAGGETSSPRSAGNSRA